MKLHQLSLFLENKPGQIKIPCKALAAAGINILTLSLADTQQFGILRLIVKDWEKARKVLQEAGSVVNVTEVLALDVADQPGGLAGVLEILDQSKLAIEYMYAFTSGQRGKNAALIFRFEDPDAAIKVLQAKGISIVAPNDLFARLEE
ncbi:MAG: amino acid-binding protein [Phycisphaerae bacterium]